MTAGLMTASVTLTANTAGTAIFSDRYAYVEVTNEGTAPVYASTNPSVTAPGAGTVDTVQVSSGQTIVLGNAARPWYQSSRVLAEGDDNAQQESRAGQLANPGTVVNLMSTSAATVIVNAAG